MGGIVTLGKRKSALSNTPMSGGTDKPNTTGPGGDRVAGTPQTTVSTPDTASGARQVSSPSGTAGSYATASSTVRETKSDPYGYSPDSPNTYGLGPIDTHGPSAPETSEPPLEPADVYMPPPEVDRTSESKLLQRVTYPKARNCSRSAAGQIPTGYIKHERHCRGSNICRAVFRESGRLCNPWGRQSTCNLLRRRSQNCNRSCRFRLCDIQAGQRIAGGQ